MSKLNERRTALKRSSLNLLWILLLLGLIACSGAADTPTATATVSTKASTEIASTNAPLPTATAVPTATSEPTPTIPIPNVQVREQILTEDGQLSIDSVTVPDEGWLVVYQEIDGALGDMLGYQALPAGTTSPVTLKIKAREASPTLIARLHLDAGTSGQFEYPGIDQPFKVGSREATAIFDVDIQLPEPVVEVADQAVDVDGIVNIAKVFALEPGWLVIHSLVDGNIGPAIGQIPVDAGQNEDLNFSIRWNVASKKLIAILYEDKERPGGFDHYTDLPVLSEGVPVLDEFEVTLPPDVLIYDQPIIDGKLIIDRAISNGPGWITVQVDEDGHPGFIIGFAALHDGINEKVELELIETAATPILYLNLHEDTGIIGEFEFPATDLPLFYEGEVLPPFTVNSNPGNYLISADQTLNEENQVIVPVVSADLATWLVVYTNDGENGLGELLGHTWLPAGINRNVPVTLPSGLEERNLLAVLHQDAGTPEQFDFPGGVDIPLQRNRLIIQSPFTIQILPDSERNIP